jgi:hypothetical protein
VPGANTAVTPGGNALIVKATLAAKPFWAVIVTGYPALLPATTLWLAGIVLMVKSGVAVTASVMFEVWLKLPLVAVIVKG